MKQRFFERDSNPSLNTLQSKPQTTHEKIMILWIIFGRKLLGSLSM